MKLNYLKEMKVTFWFRTHCLRARLFLRNLWSKACDPCGSATDLLSHENRPLNQGGSTLQARGDSVPMLQLLWPSQDREVGPVEVWPLSLQRSGPCCRHFHHRVMWRVITANVAISPIARQCYGMCARSVGFFPSVYSLFRSKSHFWKNNSSKSQVINVIISISAPPTAPIQKGIITLLYQPN